MKLSGKCPKCDSTHIITDAKAIDRGDGNAQWDLSVAVFRKPEALLFKGQETSTISAWVCGSCGFIEFYADAPSVLRLDQP